MSWKTFMVLAEATCSKALAKAWQQKSVCLVLEFIIHIVCYKQDPALEVGVPLLSIGGSCNNGVGASSIIQQ